MKRVSNGKSLKRLVAAALFAALGCGFVAAQESARPALNPAASDRLPTRVDGRPVAPELGCFWSFKEPGGDDYKDYIDAIGPVGAFDGLVLTLRGLPSLDGNAAAVATTKEAVEYAREKFGIGTLLDVDLRIARSDFEKRFPNLLQERLLFKEVDLRTPDADGKVRLALEAANLSDHYTGNYPYFVRGARLVRFWTYRKNAAGEIDPSSIVAYPNRSEAEIPAIPEKPGVASAPGTNRFETAFDAENSLEELREKGDFLTAAVAFAYSYPDLFADETLELERRVYEQFRDVPALGICMDEWGFPPAFDRVPRTDDFWYSRRTNAAYIEKFGSETARKAASELGPENVENDLVDDLFLAFLPQEGRQAERVAALDDYKNLCFDRVLEYETLNYRLTKEIWGPEAFVGVHNTWFPWPGAQESRKNGLAWWKVERDFAQTDEFAPFCCRNAMAKGTDSVWINMFYARQIPPYIWEHWTAAASGGRVHIHQIYPRDENSPKNERESKMLPIIEDGGVAKIRAKIRMLSLISNAPLDAPVAVVFGRRGATNPLRPESCRIGVDLCDRFATRGFPADAIPCDEISSTNLDGSPRWTKSDDGFLQYGPQRYREVVFWGENDADAADFAAIRELAGENCTTKISAISATSTAEERDAFAAELVERLTAAKVAPQTPWVRDEFNFGHPDEVSTRPQRVSNSRFVDGTILWIAAKESDFGDPITLDGAKISLDDGRETPEITASANGVFAVRFDENGQLNAAAGAALRRLCVGEFNVEISETEIGADPVDVAIWKDANGVWRGVFQRGENVLPPSLEKTPVDWKWLRRR